MRHGLTKGLKDHVKRVLVQTALHCQIVHRKRTCVRVCKLTFEFLLNLTELSSAIDNIGLGLHRSLAQIDLYEENDLFQTRRGLDTFKIYIPRYLRSLSLLNLSFSLFQTLVSLSVTLFPTFASLSLLLLHLFIICQLTSPSLFV